MHIELLKKLAVKGDFKYKVAAIVLDERDNIIAQGYNLKKTHTLQAYHATKVGQGDKIYLHAEISALVKCRSKPYSILVGRIRRDGTFGNAHPCPVCMSACREAGIRKIIYSNNEGNFIEEYVT